MRDSNKKLTREDVAKMEIGQTDISRGQAVLWVVLFLLTVVAVAPLQTMLEKRDPAHVGAPQVFDIFKQLKQSPREFGQADGGFVSRLFAVNRFLLKSINEYEDELEKSSFLEKALLPAMQLAFSRTVGLGNEQAYLGQGQWLFYRPGVDSVMGPGFMDARRQLRRSRSGNEWQAAPQPNPLLAIEQFRDQLAARDIQLVLMPCPIKATIHPEHLSSHYEGRDGPLWNESFLGFMNDIDDMGIPMFIPDNIVTQIDGDAFLKTDTHWTPQAMDACAVGLADFLTDLDPSLAGSAAYREEHATVSALGDIALMLKLPEDQGLYQKETVDVAIVKTPDGQPWQKDRSASVLLLGDSFSNIYSLEQMNWGGHAGLAERLSFHLRMPVDAIIQNDAGAHATRRELARQLLQGQDRLAGKKVVVWEFAARELAVGDWKEIPLPMGVQTAPEGATGFLELNASESVDVEGVIAEATDVPTPGTVPYKDHIRTLHLQELTPVNPVQVLGGNEAVVYIWSMRDNEWTSAARLKAGERVSLRLSSWSDVSDKLESINRSDVEDIDLQLETPCWGEMK